MDILKKILTVMVVVLVLIIIAGGIYTFGMGKMNHGKTGQMDMTTGQNQQETSKQNPENGGSGIAGDGNSMTAEQQQKTAAQQKVTANQQTGPAENQQTGPTNPNKQQAGEENKPNNQLPSQAGAPIIIQSPPPASKNTQLYVEQLRDKVKAIDEANSKIASNTGQTMVMQQNGSVASTGQGSMNELHQGFYTLGQSVTAMEQTIDNLDRETRDTNAAGPQYYNAAPSAAQYPAQQPSPYPYGYPQNLYPNYYQTPNSLNSLNSLNTPNLNSSAQGQQPVQQSGQTGQAADQTGSMGSMQMSQDTTMNNGGISGLFNSKTMNLVFTLVLLVSIFLGIVAVVGFISSLFKGSSSQENARI